MSENIMSEVKIASEADYRNINIAFNAGFDCGWRSGARFMARAVHRLRPKTAAAVDAAAAIATADKPNRHGNGLHP